MKRELKQATIKPNRAKKANVFCRIKPEVKEEFKLNCKTIKSDQSKEVEKFILQFNNKFK